MLINFFVQFVHKSLIFGLINPTIPVLNKVDTYILVYFYVRFSVFFPSESHKLLRSQ